MSPRVRLSEYYCCVLVERTRRYTTRHDGVPFNGFVQLRRESKSRRAELRTSLQTVVKATSPRAGFLPGGIDIVRVNIGFRLFRTGIHLAENYGRIVREFDDACYSGFGA